MKEMSDTKPREDVEAPPCAHCGGDPYDPRHIPGQGKRHDYEPQTQCHRERVKFDVCPSCGVEGHCECY